MKAIAALVAYYGQHNPHLPTTHSNPVNRPGYLAQTVDSLRSLASDIVIGTHVHDSTVPAIPGVRRRVFNCAPHFIPASLLRWAQDRLDQFPGDIYYTEADQVLRWAPEVLSVVSGDSYLVPHRIAQMGQGGERRAFGPVVEWAGGPPGSRWELDNGAVQPALHGEPAGFYHPLATDTETTRCLQYGAAFLCTPELLAKTTFTDSFPDRPLEHASGFDISATGYALKTSNWQEFFVVHLSGYEITEGLGGRSVVRG